MKKNLTSMATITLSLALCLYSTVDSQTPKRAASQTMSPADYHSDPAYTRARDVLAKARALSNFQMLLETNSRFSSLYINLSNFIAGVEGRRPDLVSSGALTELAQSSLKGYSDALDNEFINPTAQPTLTPKPGATPVVWAKPTPYPTPQIDFKTYGAKPGAGPIIRVSVAHEQDGKLKRAFASETTDDLGVLINAANAQLLRSGRGTISVEGGGTIRTQVVVDFPIVFDSQTYICQTQTPYAGCILLGDNVSAVGTWRTPDFPATATTEQRIAQTRAVKGTMIIEPTYQLNGAVPSVTIFQAQRDSGGDHTDQPSRISVTGFHFVGAQTLYDGGVRSTVEFGNCHSCLDSNNFYDTTASIGMEFGGDPAKGGYAQHCLVYQSVFYQVPGANAACVNCDDVLFVKNQMLAPSRSAPFGGGVSGIDLEPNIPLDKMQNIGVYNNFISYEGSARFAAGNALALQNPYQLKNGQVGNIIVANNILRGGLKSGYDRTMSNGIFVNGPIPNLTIVNNYTNLAGQSGISLALGGQGYVVQDNEVENCGGGGAWAIILQSVSGAKLIRNYVHDNPPDPPFSTASSIRLCESPGNAFEKNIVEEKWTKLYGVPVDRPCK